MSFCSVDIHFPASNTKNICVTFTLKAQKRFSKSCNFIWLYAVWIISFFSPRDEKALKIETIWRKKQHLKKSCDAQTLKVNVSWYIFFPFFKSISKNAPLYTWRFFQQYKMLSSLCHWTRAPSASSVVALCCVITPCSTLPWIAGSTRLSKRVI